LLEADRELLNNLVKLEHISLLEPEFIVSDSYFEFKPTYTRIKDTTQKNIETLKGIFTNFTKNY
jgi:hypothetical protein